MGNFPVAPLHLWELMMKTLIHFQDIHIREGETFRLPSCIPHSPQRFENTMGLVIERKRTEDEWDGLRWYCSDGTTILFQKFFHLGSLVVDMPPVFNEYFASEQYKTGRWDFVMVK